MANPPTPLTQDEIRCVQTLSMFNISARHVANEISYPRLNNTYTPAQRRVYKAQIEALVDPIRTQFMSAPPSSETAQQFVVRLIDSYPDGVLNDRIKSGIRSDESVSAGGLPKSDKARYNKEDSRLAQWRSSVGYANLISASQPDPPPPATARWAPAVEARRREQEYKARTDDKQAYALSVVNIWWASAAANTTQETASTVLASAAPTIGASATPGPYEQSI